MCLIAIALRASKYPLVIAANRDEDFDRPTLPAHFWTDSPNILGGRDALHGGSWLAVTRSGRFAAVTNLRGSVRDAQKRSRGALVSDFVRDEATASSYVDEVARRTAEYAGFHLVAGMRDEVVLLSGTGTIACPPYHVSKLGNGVRALSNAPSGTRWPKVGIAETELRKLLSIAGADDLVAATLQFLSKRLGTNQPESEVFIAGQRYGTRSSSAIVMSDEEVVFAEQSYVRGGQPDGPARCFRFALN